MLPLEVGLDVPISWHGKSVETYLERLAEVQHSLIEASNRYLKENQQKRGRDGDEVSDREPTFKVGEYVLLRYPERPPDKLSGLYRGPLVITAMERQDIVKVLDLVTNKTMDVHLDRLKKYHHSAEATPAEVLEVAAADKEEYVVEKIVDHREEGRKPKNWMFRVRWHGYEPSEDTWLPWKEVKDLAAMDVYSQEHPELSLG
jgi:hypothetical protein